MTFLLRTFAALWPWLRGRRIGVGPDDIAIGHAREQTPMLIALAGVLAVETALLAVLVPWPWLHLLDVLALLQVLGIAAAGVVHPHVVTRTELVLRDGPTKELRIPLTTIDAVRVDPRTHRERPGELSFPIGNQTDILVELHDTTRVRFRADDPRAAVNAIAAAASTRA
ncbi:hypothetical protein [Actinophytocola gossypii]|uniref:DUF304 domain-containing protein n=1 Tax=Actinophytocola gossypii TaxID=2812003 RepID=A0ABT2JL76_9PSEU|nr:hypothetical protein [Actinophytocola gossypii]MCT2588039.1 hypothetical protein [Actinophytocola gossypii]